jgi:hypothetical protein
MQEADSSKISWQEKTAYVVSFAFLVAIRIPGIFRGRFWAEEGNIFFANAWHLPWYQALIVSYGGYLNITANFAGVLARYLAPLDRACFVTTFFALVIQTFPAILLCQSKMTWLQSRKILIAALLIVATLPLSQEIWLSTIGSQCHLTLCVGLILCLEARSKLAGAFQKFILIIAPLSGPGSTFFLPLFLARAWIDRSTDGSKERLKQALILGFAILIQFCFFFRPQERAAITPVSGTDPQLLLNIFCVRHILGPFLGMQQTSDITATWREAYLQQHISCNWASIATVLFFLICTTMLWLSKQTTPKWLFASGLMLALLSHFGALGDHSGLLLPAASERYFFAPQILFELSILCLACSDKRWIKCFSKSIIAWLLVIAAHEYFWTPGYYKDGPRWSSEVKRWRRDPNYALKIWPMGLWEMHLSQRKTSN